MGWGGLGNSGEGIVVGKGKFVRGCGEGCGFVIKMVDFLLDFRFWRFFVEKDRFF